MKTISLFDMGLESFVRKYEKQYLEAIKYIYDNVLVNKEFFAYAWTNEVKHFGTRTSNRVEGAHSVLKRFLGNSQGGCVECWQQMHKMHESQLITIKAKFQQTLTFIKHEHRIDDFKGLHQHVSQYALNFIISEISRLEKSKSIAENLCGCILHKTHGLPCAHMISEYQRQSKPIPLFPHVSRLDAVFDYLPQLDILRKKWENSTDPEKSRINEMVSSFITEIAQPDKNNFQEPPAHVRAKGRKTAAEKKKEMEENSTHRDLSRHEHVPPAENWSTKTQEQAGKMEIQGHKQKRKYTKKNTEYWEQKKNRTQISEVKLECENEELVIEEGTVRTKELDVADNVVEDMVKDLVIVTEEEIKAPDECTSNIGKIDVPESRTIIDFTVDCLDEESDHDVPIYDVESVMNNQEEGNTLPEEEEEEEEEDFFCGRQT
ncbi:hypothetical protein MKX03_026227 [Papaver bracteatum]|nr:hypothetical protein MKX03_026227 [Papaver bracteatum]